MNQTELLAARINRTVDCYWYLFLVFVPNVVCGMLAAIIVGLTVGWLWRPAGAVVGLAVLLYLWARALHVAWQALRAPAPYRSQ